MPNRPERLRKVESLPINEGKEQDRLASLLLPGSKRFAQEAITAMAALFKVKKNHFSLLQSRKATDQESGLVVAWTWPQGYQPSSTPSSCHAIIGRRKYIDEFMVDVRGQRYDTRVDTTAADYEAFIAYAKLIGGGSLLAYAKLKSPELGSFPEEHDIEVAIGPTRTLLIGEGIGPQTAVMAHVEEGNVVVEEIDSRTWPANARLRPVLAIPKIIALPGDQV